LDYDINLKNENFNKIKSLKNNNTTLLNTNYNESVSHNNILKNKLDLTSNYNDSGYNHDMETDHFISKTNNSNVHHFNYNDMNLFGQIEE